MSMEPLSGYQWTKISGPSGYNIVNPTSAATDISRFCSGSIPVSIKGYR